MKRYSTPDEHTATIKRLRERRAAGMISAFVFAVAVGRIFELRHART
jgi:hypothetical protein